MNKLVKLDVLEGKKTYTVAILLIVYAVSGFLTGNLLLKEALEVLGLGALGVTLRKAL